MKMNPTVALAALALALAPAARLDAQGATGSAPRTEAHTGHHAQHAGGAKQGEHAQHAQAGHAGHHAQGRHAQHGATGMGCDHAAGGHAATPAMLLTHRAHAGLSDAQVVRLQVLRPDDAAGAQAVLTAEQRTRIAAMHAAMAGAHQAHADGGHAHGDCADCCADGKCDGEGCCKDSDCCAGGRCDAQKCRECCARMNAAAATPAAPRG